MPDLVALLPLLVVIPLTWIVYRSNKDAEVRHKILETALKQPEHPPVEVPAEYLGRLEELERRMASMQTDYVRKVAQMKTYSQRAARALDMQDEGIDGPAPSAEEQHEALERLGASGDVVEPSTDPQQTPLPAGNGSVLLGSHSRARR